MGTEQSAPRGWYTQKRPAPTRATLATRYPPSPAATHGAALGLQGPQTVRPGTKKPPSRGHRQHTATLRAGRLKMQRTVKPGGGGGRNFFEH